MIKREDYLKVPNILKHCTVALFRSGKVDGDGEKQVFYNAWLIARSHLTRYGYLKPGSEVGHPSQIRMTGKGTRRNIKHVVDGPAKTTAFDVKIDILMTIDSAKESPGTDRLITKGPTSSADLTEFKEQTKPDKPVILNTKLPKPGTKKSVEHQKPQKTIWKKLTAGAKKIKKAKKAKRA